MIDRRQFLKLSISAAIAGTAVPMRWNTSSAFAMTRLDPTTIPQFKDPMPIPRVASPVGNSTNAAHYEIAMTEFTQQLLPVNGDTPLPATRVWGYDGTYPGPTIEARRNKPTSVKWINNLPTNHLFPIDTSIHGNDGAEVRAVVHLHGAHVKPRSDGFPEDWVTPDEEKNFRVYNYENDQEPAALWYHDHTLGITAPNVQAGLAGAYIIRDEVEEALNLPSGKYEIPLVIQDRSFNEDGSLFYPSVSPIPTAPVPSILPRFVGEVNLVNGKVWPYLEVEPRKYRFRVISGANTRPYQLRITDDDSGDDILFHQIGTDNSMLDAPVPVGVNGRPGVVLAPAERGDIVVDFSDFNSGDTLTLRNLSAGTFPKDPTTTGKIMQFRVGNLTGPDNSELPAALRTVPRLDPADAVKTRQLTLDQTTDEYGRPLFLQNNMHFSDPITEKPEVNTTEIWNFVNTTGGGHPMHIHQVSFEVLWRRNFDVGHFKSTGEIIFTGPELPPPPNERGLKDTVRVQPGRVASVIAHFDIKGKYVWHCHFLEHEDHDMMRPFEVV